MNDGWDVVARIGADIQAVVALMIQSIGLPPMGGCDWLRAEPPAPDLRWATLGFSGEGVAGVAVGLSPAALARVTHAMTGVPPEAQDDELLQDIVGEFANILGGNLQPLLEGTTGLCLPSRAASGALPPGPTLRCGEVAGGPIGLAVRLLTAAPRP